VHRFIILLIGSHSVHPSLRGSPIEYREWQREQREISPPIDPSGSDRGVIIATLAHGHVADAHRTAVRVSSCSSGANRHCDRRSRPLPPIPPDAAYPTAVRENPVDPSVRPTGILTRVGSVLRQSAEEASPVLRASPPSPSPPCPPPPRRSPSLRDRAPRESSFSASSHPPTFARSPLLHHRRTVVTPPALPPSSASSSCRYRYHYHSPRHYHRHGGVDDASSSTFSPAFPTCRVDLVASPPRRRPGSAVHQ